MARQSIFDMNFSKVYSALIQKAERKGRTRAEVDEVLRRMPAEIASDPAGSFLFVYFFRSHPSILLRT